MTIKIGTKTVASKVYNASWGSVEGNIADQVDLKNALDQKAPLHNAQFSGSPLVPTPNKDSNELQATNKKYVESELNEFKSYVNEQIEANKIDESTLVHTTGNETISGTKAFKGTVRILASSSSNTDTTREATEYKQLQFSDNKGTNSSYLEQVYKTDGSRTFQLLVRNSEDSGWNIPFKVTTPVYGSASDSYVTCDYTWNFTKDINGTAVSAYWADLAEYYDADADYPCGTLIQFGGSKEVTCATNTINAVVSSNPGFILNKDADFEYPCQLALVGRVPVRAIGKVKKFDYLTLSDIPGVAKTQDVALVQESSIRALEDKDTEEEGLVLCVVRLNP